MREIYGLKLPENGDAANDITVFKKLETLGEKLSENYVVGMLLSSLPKSYTTHT